MTTDPFTDAEVEAAARLLNLRGWTCFDGAHEPGEYDQCEQCRIACTGLAQSVINIARAARRDEEKHNTPAPLPTPEHRLRTLHATDPDGYCTHCTRGRIYPIPAPCDTMRVLEDGEQR